MSEEQIVINGPQTITLKAEEVGVVMQGLGEMPFRLSQPVINSILAQVRANSAAAAEKKD